MQALDNLTVVLVGTTHPGNIGSVARAMKNMSLTRLHLVSPKCFPHGDATALASGADDILASAKCFDSLDEALANSQLIFATSARVRHLPWPMLTPKQAAAKIISTAGTQHVSLVFGREHAGLTNEELSKAHFHIHIPTNENFSSMNLAMAVAVMVYECYQASNKTEVDMLPTDLAPHQDKENFYEHLATLLIQAGFLDPENPRHLMHRIRRIFAKACLEKDEVKILRGILSAFEKPLLLKE